ncbi:hypothetical protein SDC9_162018 [bioreactor metagenome]|uniref:Uncharacterized protein n=1 Tax=bioreactor metagenome TaxID=1076179 RepID=A0A645FJZ2_9ZZZZ
MDNKDDIDKNSPQEEGDQMPALVKKEGTTYKGLSLSEKKLKEITISPKIKNGKVQLDKNDSAHRYIYED